MLFIAVSFPSNFSPLVLYNKQELKHENMTNLLMTKSGKKMKQVIIMIRYVLLQNIFKLRNCKNDRTVD